MEENCTKDNKRLPFLCNCQACCREAAAGWMRLMDRVHAGELSLNEAQQIEESNR